MRGHLQVFFRDFPLQGLGKKVGYETGKKVRGKLGVRYKVID